MNRSTHGSILIVGGGPVGLMLAIRLRMLGIECRIIDKRAEPDMHSKALSLSSATLELFDQQIGITDELLELSYPNATVHIHWNGRPLHRVSLGSVPSRFSYYLMVPQYETERLLRERLAELGGIIERGVELVALSQVRDRVLVTTTSGDGGQETRFFDFVVGCDGARSTVRDLVGIKFLGHDYGMFFAMCDAPISWPGRAGKMIYSITDRGFAISIPMTNGIHRVVISGKGKLDRERPWGPEDFRARLDELGLQDLVPGESIWSSAAPIFNRLACRFRSGHVLLAGDAAHTFSPIGGQGLNTGVQDAAALAWRLAAVLHGEADEAVLDDYSEERRAYAAEVRRWTDELTRLIARIDRNEAGALRHFLPSARGGAFLAEVLPLRLAGLAGLAGVDEDSGSSAA
ncbi:MAG: FAD-dependent monooxygenase [Planctomycetes bacterium]|nr:FAD-dependent monooxygenase [Planctomycetota bacterium]